VSAEDREGAAEEAPPPAARPRRRKLVLRGALLLLTGVSLYLLAPQIVDVFSSWRSLNQLSPAWVAGMILFEAASFLALWELQRIVLRTRSWFTVGTSQLAGNAFGRIVPGGMAAAGALQYGMLARAGIPRETVASGLTAASVITFASLLALPVLSLPAILGGTPVQEGLAQSAYLGAGVFLLMLVTGAVLFVWDRPLELVGRAVQWILNRVRRKRPRLQGLPERLRQERDGLRVTLGSRWWTALVATVGKWGFDYLALVAALEAVGAEANPSLVLLAYVASSLLGMIPITPGGLGFVEAGLAGTLALAGVGGGDALVATLAYRLASFWLPLPAGAAGYWLFRRRYRDSGARDSDSGASEPAA
jgi:uncharacterized protein (TIRG00374 family)